MPHTAAKHVPASLWIVLVVTLCLFALNPYAAYAAQTCDEAGLNAAIAAGGIQTFSCGGATTITISGTKTITQNVTLDGGGLLTISGGDLYQILTVATSKTLTLQNITLTHGYTEDTQGGAIKSDTATVILDHVTISHSYSHYNGSAIYAAVVTMTNSVITDNTGNDAIYGWGSPISITNSTFTNNTGSSIHYGSGRLEIKNSSFNGGGGISVFNSTLNILGSTFSGLTGNAVRIDVSNANIANSTFSGNTYSDPDFGMGGAIYSNSNGAVNISNSTFVNNSATQGNHLYLTTATGTVTIQDSILAGSGSGDCVKTGGTLTGSGNLATDVNCPGRIGTVTGLDMTLADNGGPTLSHALLPGSNAVDVGLTCKYRSTGTNLLFSNDTTITTDQRGLPRDNPCDIGAFEWSQSVQVLADGIKIAHGSDYEFGARETSGPTISQIFSIQNNGVASLSLTAPASYPSGCALNGAFPTTIAAGSSANFTLDCTGSGAGVYAGAISFNTSDASFNPYTFNLTYTVQPPGVVGAGSAASCTDSALSLALAGAGDITFDCGGAATITVRSTKTVNANVNLDGGGQITLSGNNQVQVFIVNPGMTLTLQNLTIADGYRKGFSSSPVYNSGGGAIMNNGTLTLNHVTLTNNRAVKGNDSRGGLGGALANNGIAHINNSTLSNNTAEAGGGIYNFPTATANILASTISGNVTSIGGGGGILNQDARLNIANTTFSGNAAGSHGGALATNDAGDGVHYDPFIIRISNSTFSGNTAADMLGGIHSSRTNIGSSIVVQYSVFTGNSNGDCGGDGGGLSGTKNLTADANCPGKLGAATQVSTTLAANGGATQTHALLAGSNAIGAGGTCTTLSTGTNPLFTNGAVITLDQRGRTRFAGCDLGAFELTTPIIGLQPADQVILPGTTAVLSVAADGGSGIPLTYQWYQGEYPDTSTPLGTELTLTTPALTTLTTFWVRVSNTYDIPDWADSRAAAVSMNLPPQIIVQPASQNVNSGMTVTLSVQANSGLPLTYQWYEGASGDTSRPLVGATGQMYTTRRLYSGRSFWVRVSNLESADSATATITMVSAASASPALTYFTTGTPTLTWNRVSGATDYQIQVATTSTFTAGTVVYESGPLGAETLSHNPNPPLENDLYYWRVQAQQANGTWGGWGAAQPFVVDVP